LSDDEYAGPVPVTIAMLTYRRPADLTEAIPAVLGQMTQIGRSSRLLVVDNDPAGSAADVVKGFNDVRLVYQHEPRPGIAAARNCALDQTADNELIIFIDDDERPCDRWLELMLAAHGQFRSAAIVGAVVSDYEVQPDEWVSAGRFFVRRRLPTGTRVQVAATNNLLLDMARVRTLGLRFDERFGQSGGSDTLFTRQLAASGAELVWCDEAVVIDRVPAARLSHRWVVQRAFRSGNSWTRTSLALADGRSGRLRVRVTTIGIGSVRLLGGSARWLAGTVGRSLGLRVRGIRTIARGAGMFAGATGYVFSEYRRTPPIPLLGKTRHG
jgi:glycosyltransferase involved in cell wall biosynthesis